MSHFPVLVVTDRPGEDAVTEALIPFQEHASTGHCPREYLIFHDEEDTYHEDWATQMESMVRSPTGELPSPKRFLVPGTYSDRLPDSYTRVEVPLRELYPDFEQFMREWAGYEKRDPHMGRYGYWENPHRKWDWWEIGGRWQNALVCRDGDRTYPTNSCCVGDLDFEAIRTMRIERALKAWDDAETDRVRLKAEGMSVEYIDQHICVIFGIEPSESREAYISRRSRFTLFAVLIDGQWYERGAMGWWGVVTNADGTLDQSNTQSAAADAWQTKFDELLHNLSQDRYVTVVDCHI